MTRYNVELKKEIQTKERNNTNQDTATENANIKRITKKRNNADQIKTATDTNRVQ